MPRPQRCRKVCQEPDWVLFQPKNLDETPIVTLSVDEFEVIRLVDLEKSTHEQCAKQMDISRSTVTEIYESAREKLADCIVNGKKLFISGGNYRVCNGDAAGCCHPCGKFCHQEFNDGGPIMKVAVTYENGMIFQHFGHSAQFKIYEVENGAVVRSAVVDTNGSGHGALAGFLQAQGADALICGGIGGGARQALEAAGIRLYGGCSGAADDAVAALLDGTLVFNPDVRCSHHDDAHGGEHHCGDHGCGNHGCH